MICLLREIKENELFLLNNFLYLYVIDNNNNINLYKLITAISILIDKLDKINLFLNQNKYNNYNIIKLSILKNYFISNKFNLIFEFENILSDNV